MWVCCTDQVNQPGIGHSGLLEGRRRSLSRRMLGVEVYVTAEGLARKSASECRNYLRYRGDDCANHH